MAHGHAHLLARPFHLGGDAHGTFERIGDRLLRDDVQVVREGDINDGFVEGRRDDNGTEVGWVFVEGALDIGVALLRRQPQMLLGVNMNIRVYVHGGNGLDAAVGDVGGQEAGAPAVALSTSPHLNHAVLVGHLEIPVCVIIPFKLFSRGLAQRTPRILFKYIDERIAFLTDTGAEDGQQFGRTARVVEGGVDDVGADKGGVTGGEQLLFLLDPLFYGPVDDVDYFLLLGVFVEGMALSGLQCHFDDDEIAGRGGGGAAGPAHDAPIHLISLHCGDGDKLTVHCQCSCGMGLAGDRGKKGPSTEVVPVEVWH